MNGCKGSVDSHDIVVVVVVVGQSRFHAKKNIGLHTLLLLLFVLEPGLCLLFPSTLSILGLCNPTCHQVPFFSLQLSMVLVKDQDGVTRKYACITCIKASWSLIVSSPHLAMQAKVVAYWSRDIDRQSVSTPIVVLLKSKGKEDR